MDALASLALSPPSNTTKVALSTFNPGPDSGKESLNFLPFRSFQQSSVESHTSTSCLPPVQCALSYQVITSALFPNLHSRLAPRSFRLFPLHRPFHSISLPFAIPASPATPTTIVALHPKQHQPSLPILSSDSTTRKAGTRPTRSIDVLSPVTRRQTQGSSEENRPRETTRRREQTGGPTSPESAQRDTRPRSTFTLFQHRRHYRPFYLILLCVAGSRRRVKDIEAYPTISTNKELRTTSPTTSSRPHSLLFHRACPPQRRPLLFDKRHQLTRDA